MDLVSREEFDVVKAALGAAREEIETLNARLAALEAAGAAKPAARKRKPAAKSAAPKSTD